MSKQSLAIVVPVYNEEESLRPLYTEIMENIPKLDGLISSYKILFVDDGSSDASLQVIKELAEKDSNVHAIVFRKNFGKAVALQAAFCEVEEDIVITMDADLQDDPIELKNFILKLNEGYDVVSGWKYERHDPLEKRLPSKLFNIVLAKYTGVRLHDFDCGYKAYRKEVIKALDLYGGLHRYVPVIAHRNGFRIAEIRVHHNRRKYGKSKYNTKRYFHGLYDFISIGFLTKYNNKPLHFFGKVGYTLMFLGAAAIIGSLVWNYYQPFGGCECVVLGGSLFIVLGCQMFMFGLLGDMLVDASYRARYTDVHIKEHF